MNIQKKWREHPDTLREQGEPVDWFDTTEAECLRHTEESGYWREGTVLAMLADGQTVSTPSAQYKQKETA